MGGRILPRNSQRGTASNPRPLCIPFRPPPPSRPIFNVYVTAQRAQCLMGTMVIRNQYKSPSCANF